MPLTERRTAPLASPPYRADIDGLRAVAVLAVVVFHAFPSALPGGYIGVDIFFVISGYLISSIIYRSLEEGRFSFAAFYARRVRRIFPALLCVLLACVVAGWYVLLADEYKQLGKHTLAGTAFASNIVLWREAGYFDNAAETKPLLHLWSLGIEEQFYIAWPFLAWAACKLGWARLMLPLLVALASFWLNIHGMERDASGTFYLPMTRAWELLAGSLLAGVLLRRPRLGGPFTSHAMAVTGFALLAWGLAAIDKNTAYPGPWALIPVLGALLIIAAGPSAWLNRLLLSHRLAAGVGLISYPLYLWHWPLLSFARIVQSTTPSTTTRLAAVLLSIVLAWLTYRWIERPIRTPGAQPRTVAVLGVLMTLMAAIGLGLYFQDGLAQRQTLAHVTPPIERLTDDDPQAHAACLATYGLSHEKIRYCRLSSPMGDKPRIALLGDSHAAALYPGLSAQLAQTRRESLLMIGGRVFVNVAAYPEGNQFEMEVSRGGIKAVQFVAQEPSIQTVVVVTRGTGYLAGNGNFYLLNNPAITDRHKVLDLGLRATLDLLLRNGKKIVFVVEPPTLDFDPARCQEVRPYRLTRPDAQCTITRQAFEASHAAYRQLVFAMLKDYPQVKIFDSAQHMCDDQVCHGKQGQQVLYGDTHHLSAAGSAYLAKELVKTVVD